MRKKSKKFRNISKGYFAGVKSGLLYCVITSYSSYFDIETLLLPKNSKEYNEIFAAM